MDHSLILAKKAAGVVDDLLGNGTSPQVYYTADQNHILMEFHNYPFYGTNQKGSVYFQLPAGTFGYRQGKVLNKVLEGKECRYFQEKPGTAFKHAHVFSSGKPCWKDGRRTKAVDVIVNIIETFTHQNTSKVSVELGIIASKSMGSSDVAEENSRKHGEVVISTLHCKEIVKDHAKMSAYVSKRWQTLMTNYINQAIC